MWGLIFQPGAWWIGLHYSEDNKRYCINVVPCLTLWICRAEGRAPRRKSIYKNR